MSILRHPLLLIAALTLALLLSVQATHADAGITQVCPSKTVQPRGQTYSPGGVILTAFDKSALWVYNIDSNRRYPLPDTAPCTRNCHLSPDGTLLTYFNDPTNTFNIMRLDGTQRTLVTENAAEIQWWNPTTYLIWTGGKQAYLLPTAGGDPQWIANTQNLTSLQPGGYYGVLIQPQGDSFERWLVNTQMIGLQNVSDGRVDLGRDQAYFNASAWSPDGTWLAYVAPVDGGSGKTSSELFGIKPGDTKPTQWTNLTATDGAVRIDGVSVGALSWSPDGTKIAFWVTPITGADATQNLGQSTIHVLNITNGEVKAYCGYSTDDQTPNPSTLAWSPDGTQIAFGGALPNDLTGYYLLTLDTASGNITSLSQGVYPVLGSPDVVAWGKLAS